MFCKQCGIRNKEGVRFCERCGWEMIRPGKHSLRNNPQHGDMQQRNPQQRKPQQRNMRQEEKNRRKPLMLLIGVLLLANIIVLGWVLVGHQTTRAFNDAMEEGNRYLLAENLEQAEAHFLRAIEIKPREVEPYIQLAEIYMTWDEPGEAIAILEQGLEAVPEGDRLVLEDKLDEVLAATPSVPPSIDSEEEDPVQEKFTINWILEPSIEADDINYIREGPYARPVDIETSYAETSKQFVSHAAVIRRGNVYGLIDNNGNIIGEMEYYSIEMARSGYYLLRFINPPEVEQYTPWTPNHVLIDGELVLRDFDYSDVPTIIFHYYNQGLRHFCWNSSSWTRVPPIPIPLQSRAGIDTSTNLFTEDPEPFGVFYQGQMLTSFEFEQMGSYSEGLLAVKRDGRWGYINRYGEVIIPIEFDASWHRDRDHIWEERDFSFAASEGFVPLVRDGVWEMRTITNEQVIEPGVFEAIRPMMYGRSWVKQDGLWGIIEIIVNEDVRSVETEEENEVELDLDLYEIYREIFEQYQGFYSMEYAFYDIDGNGIPELILTARTRWRGDGDIIYIFSWSEGQVITLMDVNVLITERSEHIHSFVMDPGWIRVFDTGYIKVQNFLGGKHILIDMYRICMNGISLNHVSTLSDTRWTNIITFPPEDVYMYGTEEVTEQEWFAIMERYTGQRWVENMDSNINVQWRPMPAT